MSLKIYIWEPELGFHILISSFHEGEVGWHVMQAALKRYPSTNDLCSHFRGKLFYRTEDNGMLSVGARIAGHSGGEV